MRTDGARTTYVPRVQVIPGRRESTFLAGVAYNATFMVAILLLWWVATSTGMIAPFFLPPLTAVGSEAIKLSTSFAFWYDLGTSLFRIIAGFLLAAAVALPLGILMARSTVATKLIVPPVSFIRFVPMPAVIAGIIGILQLAAFNPANGWTNDDQFHRELADVNGDGMADIVGFGNGGMLVAFASDISRFPRKHTSHCRDRSKCRKSGPEGGRFHSDRLCSQHPGHDKEFPDE